MCGVVSQIKTVCLSFIYMAILQYRIAPRVWQVLARNNNIFLGFGSTKACSHPKINCSTLYGRLQTWRVRLTSSLPT